MERGANVVCCRLLVASCERTVYSPTVYYARVGGSGLLLRKFEHV